MKRIGSVLLAVLVIGLLAVGTASHVWAGGRITYNRVLQYGDFPVWGPFDLKNLYGVSALVESGATAGTPSTVPRFYLEWYNEGSATWTAVDTVDGYGYCFQGANTSKLCQWLVAPEYPFTSAQEIQLWRLRYYEGLWPVTRTLRYVDIVDQFGGPPYETWEYLDSIKASWDQYLPLAISDVSTATLSSGNTWVLSRGFSFDGILGAATMTILGIGLLVLRLFEVFK